MQTDRLDDPDTYGSWRNWLVPPEWTVQHGDDGSVQFDTFRVSYMWQAIAGMAALFLPLGGLPGDWWWFAPFGIPLGLVVPVAFGFVPLAERWNTTSSYRAPPMRWWFPLSVVAITGVVIGVVALWGTLVTTLFGHPLGTLSSLVATYPLGVWFAYGCRTRFVLRDGELDVHNHWYGIPTAQWDCGRKWSIDENLWSPDTEPIFELHAHVRCRNADRDRDRLPRSVEVSCFQLRTGRALRRALESAAGPRYNGRNDSGTSSSGVSFEW